MNSSSVEPDDGDRPVEREHIEALLKWYAQRVKLPTYLGLSEQWFNALHTLTLKELRWGAQQASKQDPPAYLEPQRFWTVCKGQRSFATALETQRLRRGLSKRPTTQETER